MALYTVKMKEGQMLNLVNTERIECKSCQKSFLINSNRKIKGAEVKCPWCGQMHQNQIDKKTRFEKV